MTKSRESVITFQNHLASIMDILLKNAVSEITRLFESSLAEMHSVNVTPHQMEMGASKLKHQQLNETAETDAEYCVSSGSNKTEFEAWEENLCAGTIDVFGHLVAHDNGNATKTSSATTEKQGGDSRSEDRDSDQRWNCDVWRDGNDPDSDATMNTHPVEVKLESPELDSCCSACGKMPVSAGSLCDACTTFGHQGAQINSQMSSVLQPGMKSLPSPLEEVQVAIKDILPELGTEQMNHLVDHLTRNLGLENCDDLRYVEMKDIQDLLTPAHCQKLLHSCKNTGEPFAVLKGTKSLEASLEEVKAAVKDMLPELEMEQLNSLVDHLTRVIGVEHCDDFKYVEMQDVQDLLTPAQCQKLLQSCKKTGSLTGQVLPCFPSSPLPSKSPMRKKGEPPSLPIGSPALPTRPPKINLSRSWVNSFRVPWERTAPRLREAMAKGHRADPADRRHMIRAIVGKMLWYCPNPNRKACAEVARTIVAKYPHTFGDLTEEGELLGTGYHSLLTQIKTRVENVNRNNVVNRIRRPKRSNADQGSEGSSRPAKYLRTNVDGYGCVSWQPLELPVGETEETLESKRQEMVAIFNKLGPNGAALADVDKYMSVTYISQRQMINRCPPPAISEVQQQWPFLFTQKGLFAHFHRLMGVEIESRLSDSLSNKGRRVVNFFQGQKTKWSTEIQGLLSEIEGDVNGTDRDLTAIAAIMLVMKRFKEKEDSVFLSANASATKTDIEEQLALPVTPRLIMLGSSLLTATRWMVSLEGKVAYVLEDNCNFAAALAVFFSCYYVFNLEYQEAACATLELIQRFFARINPEYGMKCTAKVGVSRKSGAIVQRKAAAVNSHVTTFLLQLMQFQWKTQP